jgi:hypothetical protein
MKPRSEKASAHAARKPVSGKRTARVLASCPVGGMGWCPYPFSPAQLARHLKRKAEMQASSGVQAGRAR